MHTYLQNYSFQVLNIMDVMDRVVDTVSNWPWKKIAIGSAVAFAGYAVYFDYKRRSHPNYQQHIRERELQHLIFLQIIMLLLLGRRLKGQGGATPATEMALPNMRDNQEVQAFFLQEVQLGEELMSSRKFSFHL